VLLNAIASNGKRWRIHFERGKYEIRDLELYWDPNYVVTEPTYQKVMEAGAAYVYLFHELLHFHRIQLGIYKSVYTGSQDPREEYPVTGLYETKNDAFPKVETNEPGIDSINENAFRRELRLPRRPCYFFTMTNPDLYRAEAFVRSGFLQSNGKFLDPQGYLTYNSEECRFPYIYRRARGAFRTEPQGARLASRGSTSRFRGPSAVG
jgi:hypothetical protein